MVYNDRGEWYSDFIIPIMIVAVAVTAFILCGGLVLWLLISGFFITLLPAYIVCSGALLVMCGLLCGPLIPRIYSWRRVNQRRQAAASGDPAGIVPLASRQPLPDEQALPLPFTLRLKPNWRNWLGLSGLFVLCYLGLLLLTNGRNWLQELENPSNLSIPYLPSLIGMQLMQRSFRYQRIEVTPDALRVDAALIHWNEACLFAIRGGGKPGGPALQYELSGATRVLVWQHLRRDHWWSLFTPPMPFDEYEQQMARLLAYIAARTGLPLYDVR